MAVGDRQLADQPGAGGRRRPRPADRRPRAPRRGRRRLVGARTPSSHHRHRPGRHSVDVEAATAAAAEAVVVANFNHGHLKTAEPLPPASARPRCSSPPGQRAQLERGLVIGEAINAARLLANEPGNVLTPRALVERAAALAAEPGVQAEILGPDKIEALGMGLLLGVARGSRRAAAPAVPHLHAARRRRRDRCSAWSARASPSTPAASRSSRPTAWTG